MIFSTTTLAYLIFSSVFFILTVRIFLNWKREKNVISKLFFLIAASFLLFLVITALRLLFFINNPSKLATTIYISTFVQAIAFAVIAYFVMYMKLQKISPWFGAVPVLILGLIATFLSKPALYSPYLESSGAVNWGITPQSMPSLLLRTFIVFITIIPMVLILLQQHRDSEDIYERRKTLGLIIFFIVGALLAVIDFIVINFLKIGAIWRDVGIIIVSAILLSTIFLPGNKEK